MLSQYFKIHGRESGELRSAVVLGVKKAVRIDCAKRRKLSFTSDMVARDTLGDQLASLAFRCGFCHLLRLSEHLNPSGSKLFRHCILAKHVVLQGR
jgi:hypothetical protein